MAAESHVCSRVVVAVRRRVALPQCEEAVAVGAGYRRHQQVVVAALPVTTSYLPREEAEMRLPNMHQVPEDADPIRVVRIGEDDRLVDERACIGTHVANTSEIRNLRLTTLREEEPSRWRVNLVVG